jgi:diguanylate cyclase (GGDEF)-like protein
LNHNHDRASSPDDAPAVMARVLAVLFFAGAFSGALTLLLPHSPSANEPALWGNVVIAATTSLLLLAGAGRLRPWLIQFVVFVGTLAITRAVFYSGEAGSFYSLWYVWVGLYSFFFFGRRWGMVHLGLVAVAYGWVLTQLPYSSSVVRWLMTLATLAIAGTLIDILIGRLRRREEAASLRARSLEIVYETAHDLARLTTASEAGTAVCRAAAGAAGAAGASLWEPAPDGRALVVTASTQPELVGASAYFIGPSSGLLDAFSSASRRFSPDADANTGNPGAAAGSVLFQPILLDRVAIGVLAIRWGKRVAGMEEELDQVVSLLALEAALALDRAATLARLERVARTDDLTGLANRRAWDEHMRREVERARRADSTLAVALLDLDQFKDYNDVHGHPAGDRLLKQVGASWARVTRATDILARYGGEEFALALPAVDLAEARETLERIRAEMPEDQRVSAGLVFWDGEEDPLELVARADRALYAAKAAGRDRVVVG